MNLRSTALRAAAAAILILSPLGVARASSIPMPAGSRSWIIIGAGDCDDDGQGTVDRGHCAAAVSQFIQPGDIGHNIYQNYQILAQADITAQAFHGSVQTTGGSQFAFLDMSMVDTYTLNSASLPAGTVVPVTASFHATADLIPEGIFSSSGVLLGYGGGAFTIKIGNYFNPSPIVIPENTRVQNPFGAGAEPSFFTFPSPGPATTPLDLTATATFDVTIGTPFDLAFYLGARPAAATIDFTHTATIGFSVPDGTYMTSTGGFGGPTPVQRETWGGVKALYR